MIDSIINIINENSTFISIIMIILGFVLYLFAYAMFATYQPRSKSITMSVISIAFFSFGVYLTFNDPNPNSFATKYNQPYIEGARLISTYDNKNVNLPKELNNDFIKHIKETKKDKPIIHTHYDEIKKTYTILYADYEKQTVLLSDILTTETEKDMNEAKKAFNNQE